MFSLFLDNLHETDLVYSYLLEHDSDKFEVYRKDNKVACYYSSLSSFARLITNLIIDLYEENIIRQILEKHYCYFSSYEQLEILRESANIVKDEQNSKQDLVYLSVFDYLKEESSMLLSGFIKFRLKDYIEVLEYLIDLSVNTFVINREYNRFVLLLKEYITSSESKMDVVHLIYLKEKSILLDEEKNIIPFDDNILDAKYLSDISFSSNDFCLNTLLNIVPKKIFVHCFTESDIFLQTLKKIFNARVSFCNSCELCDFYKIHAASFNIEK